VRCLAAFARQPWQLGDLQGWRQLSGPRQVHRPPQIPGRRAAVGRPALAEQGEHLRRRQFLQPIRQLESLPDAEVSHRQHIGAAQLEHQQHLHGPAADAAHRREPLDDFQVTQGMQRIPERDDSAQGLGGKIAQGRDLRE